MTKPGTPLEIRFWQKVKKTETCWLWTGSTYVTGYGQIRDNKKLIRAHRLSYMWAYGDIPDGIEIDHKCHNEDSKCLGGWNCVHRKCVNPNHLEATSKQENIKRGKCGEQHSRKTHCPQGHEYNLENTILETYKETFIRRHCRICNNDRTKKRQREKRLKERQKNE